MKNQLTNYFESEGWHLIKNGTYIKKDFKAEITEQKWDLKLVITYETPYRKLQSVSYVDNSESTVGNKLLKNIKKFQNKSASDLNDEYFKPIE